MTEGRARLILPTGQEAEKASVFYNPKMSLNRDLAILFASTYFPTRKQVRVCDAMTGSGVRAVRYVLETTNVASVVAADTSPEAVGAARKTAQLNAVEERITVLESDAVRLLQSYVPQRFDLVDLDPFGSPAPFFESALRATMDGGVIAATATDMGPLTGARPAACVRKYGAMPVRTEFEKEIAVRILAGSLAMTAGRLELGISVIFAHASDHYARIYAEVMKGRPTANKSVRTMGFVEYCSNCLRRDPRSSLDMIRTECEGCGSKTSIGGPIWLGPLWEIGTVRGMMERMPDLISSRLSEAQRIITCIEGEYNAPAFYYRTDAVSRSLKTKPAGLEMVLKTFHEAGYSATRTHFHPNGFRTNASNREIMAIMGGLSHKA